MTKDEIDTEIHHLRIAMRNCMVCSGSQMIFGDDGYKWCPKCSSRIEEINKLDAQRKAGPDPKKALEEARAAIKQAEGNLEDAHEIQRNLYANILKAHGLNSRDIVIPGTWKCGNSPVGRCVYNTFEDPSHDDCLICHEPEERK